MAGGRANGDPASDATFLSAALAPNPLRPSGIPCEYRQVLVASREFHQHGTARTHETPARRWAHRLVRSPRGFHVVPRRRGTLASPTCTSAFGLPGAPH